ncbi:Zinc carboxypeptidase [Flavobacterium sp. 9AF]|nr:Zinc carboxypeptidase [Flavobacterium sp. 9AF]
MFFLSLTSIWAQFNPQSKKITEKFFPDTDKIKDVTPGLKKNKGFTNYEELISFLTTLQEEHSDWVTLEYIGASQKGLKIPLIKLTNHKLNQEKLKIWIQGGLHGNEPASSEGVLYILYTLLNDPEYKYLLNSIELAVVPMANIDGYLKQNRYAANGLDLNRDQTKLMAPESVAIKQAFSNFDPEVGLDFHEYNPYRRDFTKLHNYGIAAYYDAMMLYSGNLNVPKNIRQLTETLFVESTRKELEINNLTSRDYVSTEDFEGEIRFNRGSTNARSSATSYALTNTISTLVEVRGVGLDRTSFKRRIFTTFLIGMNYIKIAHKNAEIIKQEIAKARYNMGEITVTSSQEVYKDDILAIDLEADDLIKLPVTIRDALLSKPKLVRPLPEAYIINHNQPEIIEKMKVLGIKIDTLSEEKQFTVECYLISSIEDNSVPYEKMNLQKVTTEIVNRVIRFPKGTYIISTDQKNKPILTEVLEPEAPNSFISFGVLRTKLNEELPIYRLLKKN